MRSTPKTDEQKESPLSLVKRKFGGFFNENHVLEKVKILHGGLTNETYVAIDEPKIPGRSGSKYVVRVPGAGTEQYINREHEAFNMQLVSGAGIAPEVVYDDKHGERVSRYLENPMVMTTQLMEYPVYLEAIAGVMKNLHSITTPFANDVDLFPRNRQMAQIIIDKKPELFTGELLRISGQIDAIEHCLGRLKIEKKCCHTDTTVKNFMISGRRMWMIDFEYGGNCDPMYDLACFSMEAKLKPWQDDILLRAYCGNHNPQKDLVRRFQMYKPVVEYYTALWCLVQLANGNTKGGEIEALLQERLENCKVELQKLHAYDREFSHAANPRQWETLCEKLRMRF